MLFGSLVYGALEPGIEAVVVGLDRGTVTSVTAILSSPLTDEALVSKLGVPELTDKSDDASRLWFYFSEDKQYQLLFYESQPLGGQHPWRRARAPSR